MAASKLHVRFVAGNGAERHEPKPLYARDAVASNDAGLGQSHHARILVEREEVFCPHSIAPLRPTKMTFVSVLVLRNWMSKIGAPMGNEPPFVLFE
eukprot:2698088-Rhodomonas_salina.4